MEYLHAKMCNASCTLACWGRIYWGAMPWPERSRLVGTITRLSMGGDTGALILMGSGIYVQGNDGAIRDLHQGQVIAAIAIAKAEGRAAKP